MKVKTIFKRFVLFICCFIQTPILVGARQVIPGGENIGIELRSNGLIVTGTYDVKHSGGVYNPQSSDIKRGDKIIAANEIATPSVEALVGILKALSVDSVKLKMQRDFTEITRTLKLYKNPTTNSWKTGLFVKEKVMGIGTISYYDPENGTYGALGHQINDSDTGRIFEISYGSIYESDVLSVKKSETGNPGEKVAQIDTSTMIGNVTSNTEYGIFGNYSGKKAGSAMDVAEINEVKLGNAEIWTVISGSKVEKFTISITSLKPQTTADIKGISFKVTDQKLLSKTNGIVQGMSGSPIIQGDKIIGAVTHVLIDKPASGYGIYLIHMLEQSDKVVQR